MLQTTERGSTSVGGFVGTENGKDYIFLFFINKNGNLAVSINSVEITQNNGNIKHYYLLERDIGIIDVYCVDDNALKVVQLPLETNGFILNKVLSSTSEKLIEYAVFNPIFNKPKISYGWYLIEISDTQRDVVLFKCKDNLVIQQEKITGFSPSVQLTLEESFNGTVYYKIIDKNAVRLIYPSDAGFYNKANFIVPFPIKSFLNLDELSAGLGLLVSPTGTGEKLYLVENIGLTPPVFTSLLIDKELSAVSFILLDNVHLLFLSESLGWDSYILDLQTKDIIINSIPVGTGRPMLFYSIYVDVPQIIMFENGSPPVFTYYTFSESKWNKCNDFVAHDALPYLRDIEETIKASRAENIFINGNLLLMKIPSGFLIINKSGVNMSFLPCRLTSLSLKVNDLQFVSISDAKNIIVYTIGEQKK